MSQNFTIHTHTTVSDGKNTPQEMAAHAAKQGFKIIGFSDHFIVNPNFVGTDLYAKLQNSNHANIYNTDFQKTTSVFQQAFADTEHIAAKNNIKILRGLELDVFSGDKWLQDLKKSVDVLKPDYIIGSAHFIEYNNKIYNMYDIQHASAELADELVVAYWKKIQFIAKSGLCNIMAHLDLPRRRDTGTEEKWADLERETVEVIAKQKLPVEINTALYTEEQTFPHPAPRIMKMCAEYNIPMFVSDDAHSAIHLAHKFGAAQNYAKRFGINLVGLEKIL
jgi:HisJ family histidinol phosphate phosphatase